MMIKRAILAAACAAAWFVSASQTTSNMAITAANAWVSANASTFSVPGVATEAVAEYDADGVLLWWTVPLSGGGALFIAPDTRIEPVIAVVPKYGGSLPANHPLRAILTADIANRLAYIKRLSASGSSRVLLLTSGSASSETDGAVAKSAAAAKSKWADLVPTGPLLLTQNPSTYPSPITGGEYPAHVLGICPGFEYGGVYTHWNQSSSPYSTEPDANCYNYYTPRHAVCGCVATAGAAVMQYFGVTGPVYNATNVCTWGTILSGYYIEDDFTMIGATNSYDWSILPENLGGTAPSTSNGSLSKEQVELLGRVTYDMGVGVSMAWAADGIGDASGAFVHSLSTAFRDYYGFKDARYVYVPLISKDEAYQDAVSKPYLDAYGEINRKFIYAQLRNNIPVPLGICTKGASGGHAVVAVGYGLDYADTGYTRIFMGWGGSSDAWYCLPEIAEFNVIDEIITMIGKDDRKTVPVFGRVTTESGDGAAFAEIKVGNITNVYTDAEGYWSTRIDETSLTLGSSNKEVYNSSVTNFCAADDAEAIAAIDAEVAAFQEANGGAASATNSFNAVISNSVAGVQTISNAVIMVNTVYKGAVTDGDVTNSVFIVTNVVAHIRPYSLDVTCVSSGEKVPVTIGAYAFDTVFDEESESYYSDTTGLMVSLPDEIPFVVPDSTALTAYSGTIDPDEVAAEAAAAGKMMFLVSGFPDTEEYKAILSYLQKNAAEFSENYVLYLINPAADSYLMKDADPSFGVFDPDYFNSQAANRWAYYNGRLAYFDASSGVTDADIQNVLAEGNARYPKLHDDIRITVNAVGSPESLWDDGIPAGTEGFLSDATNWMNIAVAGLGVHSNAFANGQEVTFTSPSVITNNNTVWMPAGWLVIDDADKEALEKAYSYWMSARISWAQDPVSWEAENPVPPERFDVSWYWNDEWGDVPLWITNTDQNVTSASFTVTSNVYYSLYWIWEPSEVYISVTGVNGTVNPGSGWYGYSTNEADAVEFTASSDLAGSRFAGWEEETLGAFSDNPIRVVPEYPFSLTAVYTTDTSTYLFTINSDPSDIAAETAVTYNGAPLDVTAGRFSKRPGTVELVTAEAVTNVTATAEGEVTNVLYCVGWYGTGSVPARGKGNVCSCVFTENSSITWLWRDENWVDPYEECDIVFTVDAGIGAPDGVSYPAVGTHEEAYTNGQTVVCTAIPGVTNVEEQVAVVCAGWTLSNVVDGVEIASGEGATAEVTFNETNVHWKLTWLWRTDELVRITVNGGDYGMASAPDGFYLKGDPVEVVVTANNSYVLDGWEGDIEGCVFSGYSAGLGYTITVPTDANRTINAVFKTGSGAATLSYCSMCTNDAGGVEVDWGIVTPELTDEPFTTGGTVTFLISDECITNVVNDVTNVWVCAGWKVYDVNTNLAADASHVLAEGEGTTASFTFTRESKLIWIWKEPSAGPSPLPATLEGPNGEPVITVGSGSSVARISNTAAGWWYGLYSKTSLSDPSEEWTLVPGKAVLAVEDNAVITLEVAWDPSEPTKFFKIMVTAEDPR